MASNATELAKILKTAIEVEDNGLALLVNPALVMLGADTLTALSTSTNTVQNLASITFLMLVEEVLMEANWAGIQKRATTLAADSDHVNDEFYYGFALPSDFVHLVGEPRYIRAAVFPPGQKHWRIVGTKLETDYAGPDILYVYNPGYAVNDNETPDDYYTLMNAPLRSAIIAKLMAAWADPIAGKDPVKYEQLYQIKLRQAQAKNAKQSPPPQITPNSLMVQRQSHA